ncbi:hypothetical protein [Draconibacterium sp.]|uniref:hypothetical protein n=1 Tax=Draconibacterium sp. TaxID=1965318 RepID=UPI0035646CDE
MTQLLMNNDNLKIGLSKRDDIPRLYTILVLYEKDICKKAGQYNINAPSFVAFCKRNDIKCKNSIAKKELNKKDKTQNYFYFSTKQTKVSKTDHAHHLLRHIRNSIAHALVTKKKGFYIITDKNSSLSISMTAKIRIDLFDGFITELIKTQSNIKK